MENDKINMKKNKNILSIILLIFMLFSLICSNSLAHGGNIKGWKDKNSQYIVEHEGKYYGYHKQNGVIHYHQVKWNDEDKKWVIVAPAVYYDENFNKIQNNENKDTNKIEVELDSIVDGDTAKFNMNEEVVTVRFLGINTKETVHPEIGEEPFGKEASNYTKEKLENANKIELEFDKSASEKDKYDRYLAWVFVDDVLLQELLTENGLAETYMLQNNYKYAGVLQESEEIAKNKTLEEQMEYARAAYFKFKQTYDYEEAKTREKLESQINELFKQIYAGGMTINIDEKYKITSYVNELEENSSNLDANTAKSYSIIFAFIVGVINLAKQKVLEKTDDASIVTDEYPLVMDAPLSSFDQRRIKNICEGIPSIARQVIIFIKDSDGNIAKKEMSGKIGTEYEVSLRDREMPVDSKITKVGEN